MWQNTRAAWAIRGRTARLVWIDAEEVRQFTPLFGDGRHMALCDGIIVGRRRTGRHGFKNDDDDPQRSQRAPRLWTRPEQFTQPPPWASVLRGNVARRLRLGLLQNLRPPFRWHRF